MEESKSMPEEIECIGCGSLIYLSDAIKTEWGYVCDSCQHNMDDYKKEISCQD